MSPLLSSLPAPAPDPWRRRCTTPAGPRRPARAHQSFACALLGALLALGAPSLALAESRKGDAPASKPHAEAAAPNSQLAPASPPAPKQDPVEQCLEDHARGQELRLGRKLLDARETFLRCAATHCPNQIQRDCSMYLEQIQLQVPSVALRVTADGVSRGDVKVFLDGKLALDKLTGKAIDLDPGTHQLRVVLPPYPAHEETLIVSEGERFRVVEVTFKRAHPLATPATAENTERRLEMRRPVPTSSYIFGTVGAAALLSGVGWGLSTWVLKGELEAGCAPNCDQRSVDVLKQRALFADVSWGVAATSLITASVFYLIRPEVPVEMVDKVEVGVSWLNERGAIGTIGISAF